MFQGVGKRLKRSQETLCYILLAKRYGPSERRVRRNDMKMRVLFIVGLPYKFFVFSSIAFQSFIRRIIWVTVKTKKFCERAVGTIELRDV